MQSVGESVAKPIYYYENNITGTINLVKALQKAGCKRIGERKYECCGGVS